MMTQQLFINRVRNRLGRSGAEGEPQWTPSLPIPTPGPTETEALVERYQLELGKLMGKTYRVMSEAEVAPLVIGILKEIGATGSVMRWDDAAINGLGLDEALTGAGFAVATMKHGEPGRPQVEAAERAIAGITGADMAIAETGTLVMASAQLGVAGAPGRGRTVSLLPPIHIAVLRKEQIVYTPAQVFAKLRKLGILPSQVVFASGPSRSADIENDLSIGVHGPVQAHVIII
ncbi:MAG TPA: lactate utilization protein C [Symbiobacteriaceae bacterium]|nr:lactate utilization protein C [Symbiobacteriaceae bacterium]